MDLGDHGVVDTLQMELENALALNRTWWRHGTDSRATGDPVQLLVMSRSEDLASPFLHSYTTDAVVRDVLQDQFKGADRIEYATKSRKNEAMTSTVVVNSTNKLWAALSRRRIYDASSDVHGLKTPSRAPCCPSRASGTTGQSASDAS
mgnify:CR=1 FL=1